MATASHLLPRIAVIAKSSWKSVVVRALAITTAWILLLCIHEALAAPPTDEAVARWEREGVLQRKLENLSAFKSFGGCEPEIVQPRRNKIDGLSLSASANSVDTIHTLVLLLDFSDWPASGQGAYGSSKDFDSILFTIRDTDSIHNATGSMSDYYLENSYGRLLIQGDIVGWLRMPRTYAWYEGGDDGLTRGRILAYDAAIAAEVAGVNFSLYDHNSDGTCDGLILIHAGAGAEAGGYGIWSHKWTVSPSVVLDGVLISAYTMNPEEDGTTGRLSSIGVFCHEFGHFLGLPDLYDIDGVPTSSQGLGNWSLMASGCYNGNSRSPSHLDAWCKTEIGFVSPTAITTNMYQAIVPEVEHNPIVYKLQNGACGSNEFFLVENRAKVGFDSFLPSEGLLIYHVDLAAPTENRDNLRYFVALEQADGRNDLAFGVGNRGDGGDPWREGMSTEFSDFTLPDSKTNDGAITQVAVSDISDVDSIMFANLEIEDAHPRIVIAPELPATISDTGLGGDGDGIFEAGETVSISFGVRNLMRPAYNYRFTLEGDSSVIIAGESRTGSPSTSNPAIISPTRPLTLTVREGIAPTIDTIWVEVLCDSLPSVAGGPKYSFRFPLELSFGSPQVLLVDDDRGAAYQEVYSASLARLRTPHVIWEVHTMGVPNESKLRSFRTVLWITGDSISNAIDDQRIATMKSAMTNGVSVMLVTSSGASDMAIVDSAFMANYFGAVFADTAILHPLITSVDSGRIFDSTSYFYRSDYPVHRKQMVITPTGSGRTVLKINHTWPCAVSMDTSFRSILLTIPLENINDQRLDPVDTLLARSLAFLNINTQPSSGGGEAPIPIPSTFTLSQNYPNPFNPSTTIAFTISGDDTHEPVKARLDIFNVLGEKVTTLLDGPIAAGSHTVEWSTNLSNSARIASGVYFYRLTVDNQSQTKKMVFLK